MVTENKNVKWIDDIVGIFCDPVVVSPGGWAADLPKWIFEAIRMERLIDEIKSIKSGTHTATDAEVVAYLFTANLEAPLTRDFADIYIYLTKQLIEYHKPHGPDFQFPKDLEINELRRDCLYQLERLKGDIYSARMRARVEQRRAANKEQKRQQQEQQPAEIQMTFDYNLKK